MSSMVTSNSQKHALCEISRSEESMEWMIRSGQQKLHRMWLNRRFLIFGCSLFLILGRDDFNCCDSILEDSDSSGSLQNESENLPELQDYLNSQLPGAGLCFIHNLRIVVVEVKNQTPCLVLSLRLRLSALK
ncbi:hypothetical protein CEXT_68131 [Caerostris extrusa]|uniref:Uncharacterized protein n=1 Tax=Caerostris extrusa TaxID=172846 RepID=A0AAV4NWZ2_CAEEX|nr:hypothetical protein CEXT_110001 [Caerostris extrusa]GIY60401.1 hypothetical protein CEXT_68131 [Caerostris extrusa]